LDRRSRQGDKGKEKFRINRSIRVKEVRVIDADGEQAGILSIEDALSLAAESKLDLVEVSPQVDPPVCKIMDYGKFKYENKKKLNQSKKKQKKTQVKELKLRPSTDVGDLKVKSKKLLEFLEDGDKVKITIKFRGRELTHKEIGFELMRGFKQDVEGQGVVEQEAKMEGKQMVMIFAPMNKN
tara:strand:+ start:2286 stop:2831 length:546 start_codon:yes stop_codon:yes gene_type:complete